MYCAVSKKEDGSGAVLKKLSRERALRVHIFYFNSCESLTFENPDIRKYNFHLHTTPAADRRDALGVI